MCGISGIISLDKNNTLTYIHTRQLDDMLRQIKSRGPDGSGIDTEADYAIGNVRLKIVGHKQGSQPVKNGKNVFVFNGEIYNYKELCKTHDIKDVRSDTYLFFLLLTSNSIDILSQINGMFAFCYVTEDQIFLARDRFGKKPLFYTIQDGLLYFASEMKAFLNIMDFNIKLSDTYMMFETEIADKTIFDNIHQIEAGHYLQIDRETKKIIKKQYYEIPTKTYKEKSEKQLVEELRFLVTDATNIRTDTNKALTVYASGGLDSSIVALITKPEKIFTFLPKSSHVSDEEDYIDILISKMKQTQLIKVEGDRFSFLSHFIDMVYKNEGPTTTFASLAQYYLAKEVNKNSIKIALSGIGADEFFNGYVRHAIATLPIDYIIKSQFKEYQSLIKKSKIFTDKKVSPLIMYSRLLNRSNLSNDNCKKLISEYFHKYDSSLQAISITDSLTTLPPLLRTDDYMNMAFSIESRSPFMDYRLVEFALKLPQHFKINIKKKYGIIYTKYLLRMAFKDLVPKPILDRRDKIGFTSNIPDLLRGSMSHVFKTSLFILQTAFPKHPYFRASKDELGQFSRWEYQICQLAITYLLFTKRYSREEVYKYYNTLK